MTSSNHIAGLPRIRTIEDVNEHNGVEVKAFGTMVRVASNNTTHYCLQLQDSTLLNVVSFLSHNTVADIDISTYLNQEVFIIGKVAKHSGASENESQIDMPTIFHSGNITVTAYIQSPLFLANNEELKRTVGSLPKESHYVNLRGKLLKSSTENDAFALNDGTIIKLQCTDNIDLDGSLSKELIVAGELSYSNNTYILTECAVFDYEFFVDHFSKQ